MKRKTSVPTVKTMARDRVDMGSLAPWPWAFGAGAAAGLAAAGGGAGTLSGGAGQVMAPSLMTVRPRMASSSMLTLMTPSLVLQSSSASLNRLLAYSVEDCLDRREARSVKPTMV